jgi:hypothetical protein
MNVEVYSYSLFTTVLGMLVVFIALSALSVMMVLLKRVFSGEETRDGSQRTRRERIAKPITERGKQSVTTEQMPIWVPVAIAAYLSSEQEPDRPSADPWNAVVNQYDPWISANRPSKPGV